jgi:hypothetical protein
MCAVRAKLADMKHKQPDLVADDALLQSTAKEIKATCPLDGTYLFLDTTIMCSNHGMVPDICK